MRIATHIFRFCCDIAAYNQQKSSNKHQPPSLSFYIITTTVLLLCSAMCSYQKHIAVRSRVKRLKIDIVSILNGYVKYNTAWCYILKAQLTVQSLYANMSLLLLPYECAVIDFAGKLYVLLT